MLAQSHQPHTQTPPLLLLPLLLFLLVVIPAVAVTAVITAAAACTWHRVLRWGLAPCCCLRPFNI
jgi:hypothetical protein